MYALEKILILVCREIDGAPNSPTLATDMQVYAHGSQEWYMLQGEIIVNI